MSVVEQAPTPQPKKKKRRILRNTLISIAILLITIVVALAVMFSTDKGSRFLLDRVLEQQKIIHYEYEGGNLLQGIILKHIVVTLSAVDVKIDRADVKLGWRAILDKEIHLRSADVNNLHIISKTPPSDAPFKFNEIRLPFVLRVDQAQLDQLVIQSSHSQVKLNDIELHDALWSGTELKFKNSKMDMGYLAVRNATGKMTFEGKYPLQATAILTLPALKESLNVQDIHVYAQGTLDTIQAGVATNTPDPLTGWAVLNPMQKNVPMKGALKFKNYHFPLLKEQELFAKQGIASFQGDIERLNLAVETDLKGKDIPEGQYNAVMHTDLVSTLFVDQLNAQLMKGTLNLQGQVGWKDKVSWDVKGRLEQMNPKDPLIPLAVQDFLPPQLDANIASAGHLEKGLHLTAQVDFDRYETWAVKVDQGLAKPKQPNPIQLDVSWQNIDRAVPYIGWLKSANGDAKLTLLDGQQNIHVATQITQHEKAMLPEGHYQADLNLKNNLLKVPSFKYQAAKGSLAGQANVELPTEKHQLKWNAVLNAQDFNPQTVVVTAPVDLLNGRIHAQGYAKPNQQIIQFHSIDLKGRLAQEKQAEMVELKGQSTVALLFHDQKAGGGFKSFAVNYDGALNAFQQGNGMLKVNVSGTPELINIQQFAHTGVAGKIFAQGRIDLKNGIGWDVSAALERFKPHYFVSNLRGELSGNVKTQGLWSDHAKRLLLDRLNLAGTLNGKVVRGQGKLALVFNQDQKGFLPQQFEANNLLLAYGKNQIKATGNAQKLSVQVNAPDLSDTVPGLSGRVLGYVNLQVQPRLTANTNLVVDQLAFKDILTVQRIYLKGDLPTSESVPAAMMAKITNMRSQGYVVENAQAFLRGTRQAHVLDVQINDRKPNFSVRLAGGFTAKNDWLGQIQNAALKSNYGDLLQDQHAPVIFNQAKTELYVGQHCWKNNNSKLCFDQPVRVSPTLGNVSFVTQNINFSDFSAFMPRNFGMQGALNGAAKASWSQGKKPQIDVRFLTKNGQIKVIDEHQQASWVSYQQMSLVGKSIADKLSLRLDFNTPDQQGLGKGFVDVLIDPYSQLKAMKGDIAIQDVKLAVLRPFIRDVRTLNGRLSAMGHIGGTLTTPILDLDVRLKDGAISMISLPVNLSNIQLAAKVNQSNAQLNGTFNSDRGIGILQGTANWQGARPHINLKLRGNHLRVRQTPLVDALVNVSGLDNNPNLEVDIFPNQQEIQLKGKVDVVEANISMPKASMPVVGLSPDVRVIQYGQEQINTLKNALNWNINARVDVTVGATNGKANDRVKFIGFDSQIPLAGRLQLTQKGRNIAMHAYGAIGVTHAVTIEAFGQRLDLNRAIARFNGPLSAPSLDIDANKDVQGSTVGVRVLGTATSPNIQVYNDAGMSEQEALNALLTGRVNEGSSGLSNTDGFKSDVNNSIAAAGISLGLGGTRAFTNQLGRTFGLSGLALDAQGTGDDTQLSVTGYITPDLYLRYGVGIFTPVNKLTLRYQVNRRLYLEASQSLEKAIDIFYNWRF